MSKEKKTSEAEIVLSGHIVHGQGMTMALSEAANCLPEGHVLHWHTERNPNFKPVEQEAPATDQQEEAAAA